VIGLAMAPKTVPWPAPDATSPLDRQWSHPAAAVADTAEDVHAFSTLACVRIALMALPR
jgi:hypothetical protein